MENPSYASKVKPLYLEHTGNVEFEDREEEADKETDHGSDYGDKKELALLIKSYENLGCLHPAFTTEQTEKILLRPRKPAAC